MEQNQQNEKFHVVVTNVATGKVVLDATEIAMAVATSDVAEVADGETISIQTFLNGKGMDIARLIESNDGLYKCALLAQLIRTMRTQGKEDIQ